MKIYVASKATHAHRWLEYRELGHNIISTWINEAGQGATKDHTDLWRRCIKEASECDVLIALHYPKDIQKGALVEIGAALAHGKRVILVGYEDVRDVYSVSCHPNVMLSDSLFGAFHWCRMQDDKKENPE